MKLYKTMQFHAAHFLELPYESPCNNLHGHTYRVEITVYSTDDFKEDMLVDFSVLKEVVMRLDHSNLNDIIDTPTAENIVRYLLKRFKEILKSMSGIKSVKVRVWETPTSSVEDYANI